MPDDPTAPALEMTATQVATQRLTLRVVVEQIRAQVANQRAETDSKLAALMAQMEHALSRIDEVQALAMAMGERRTEDLRRMIHEEVAAQVAPVLDSLKELTQVVPLVPTLQKLAADYEHSAHDDQVSKERMSAILIALDKLAAASWREGIKPGLYIVAGLVFTSKSQTILGLPSWTWWVTVAALLVLAATWGRIHAFLTRNRAQP